MKKNIGLWVLIGVAVFILLMVFWFIGSYNGLIRLDTEVDESWANVETQYQRRADLIPNLVNTVQGAANFEKETQTAIALLRTQAASAKAAWDGAQGVSEKIAAAKQVDKVIGGFSGLNINVERYPELKATENFLNLQAQLEGTENRVSVARTRYNEKVKQYNVKIRRIPTVFIANMFGFEKESFFESDEGSEAAPVVDFV